MSKRALAVASLVCFLSVAHEVSALDHFKLWTVDPVARPAPVSLLGQFDRGIWWSASLAEAKFIGNPVKKVHAGKTTDIVDASLHLVAYSLTTPIRQRRRIVYLTNQITGAAGVQWQIGQPLLLLVPAGKAFTPVKPSTPDQGDLFVCYDVERGPAANVGLTLEDQFDVRRGRVEAINTLRPAYFCVPTQFQAPGLIAKPLLDADTHLAIYRIAPQERVRRGRLTVNTVDQFGAQTLNVKGSTLLAVPSQKDNWTPVQP